MIQVLITKHALQRCLKSASEKLYKSMGFSQSMAQANYDEYGTKLVNESGDITFSCPSCGEVEISRSKKARELAKPYICPKCGFEGP